LWPEIVGHLLALGHSSVKDAIMYPTISSQTKKVELARNDVMSIKDVVRCNLKVIFYFLDKTRDYNKQQRAWQPNNRPKNDLTSMSKQEKEVMHQMNNAGLYFFGMKAKKIGHQ
jgi:hypothetical protein